jgi:hypothetical protein
MHDNARGSVLSLAALIQNESFIYSKIIFEDGGVSPIESKCIIYLFIE